jgi:hypothetical protein
MKQNELRRPDKIRFFRVSLETVGVSPCTGIALDSDKDAE